jgi:hypothetical protein
MLMEKLNYGIGVLSLADDNQSPDNSTATMIKNIPILSKTTIALQPK